MDFELEHPRAKEPKRALRINFEPRPSYRAACDWDRMVRVIRARDRLRLRGYAPGSVDDTGKVAVIRSLCGEAEEAV